MEQKTAQMRVLFGPRGTRRITAYGGSGQIFYETPSRATFLIGTGCFELVNSRVPLQQLPGPSQTKPAGPSEQKESLEKKSLAADQAGPSTDSASSSESGKAAVSSSSAEALVSPEPRSLLSRVRGKRGK